MQFDKGYLSPYFVSDPERMEAVLEDAYVLINQGKISAIADLLPILEKVVQVRQAAARSSPRTSTARRCRPWWSTRSAARSTSWPSRPPASATAARPCSATSPSSPAARSSPRRSASSSTRSTSTCSARPAASSSPRTTPRSSTAPATRTRSPAGSTRSRPRSSGPTPTGTARSSRSASPSSPAASASSRSAPTPRWSSRRRSTASRTPSRRPARRSRRASSPVAAPPSSTPSACSTSLDLEGDEATGANIVRKAAAEPLRWIAENAGLEGYVAVSKVGELESGNGLNAATGEYGDLIKAGVIDPVKVTRSRAAQRRVDRLDGAHHRHPRRGEEGPRSRRRRPATATATATDRPAHHTAKAATPGGRGLRPLVGGCRWLGQEGTGPAAGCRRAGRGCRGAPAAPGGGPPRRRRSPRRSRSAPVPGRRRRRHRRA